MVRLGQEIAQGLSAAHERGLIHRDIKPANIWLEAPFDRVKILDFGLAREVEGSEHLTHSGLIVGTPAYMAPEQARCEKMDGRADLFSLGCVLYRLLTGELPFKGSTSMAVLASLAYITPPSVSQLRADVPAELSDLVDELLAKDSAQRPVSARAVATRLQLLERQPAVPTEPAIASTQASAMTPASAHPDRRRSARVMLAGLVTLLILLPLGYFYGGTVVRIATNKGELVIETDDPNLEVTVKGPTATVYDKVKDRRFVLTAGEYEVEVREEGDFGVRFSTKKFTMTRGGKERLNARVELAKVKPEEKRDIIGSDERQAARWVLSIGGKVKIFKANELLEITAAKDLPTGAWQLHYIYLADNRELTDAGLKHLEALPNLTELELSRTKVTDSGLRHLERLTNLKVLGLWGNSQVSDAGLIHLKGLKKLKTLILKGSCVGDGGLEHLSRLTNLMNLDLGDTKVSSAGLANLRNLRILRLLSFGNTKVDDTGLEHLKELRNLGDLRLDDTQVTGVGLTHLMQLPALTNLGLGCATVTDPSMKHVSDLKQLQGLSLANSGITDASLTELHGLAALRELNLTGTKVTATGVCCPAQGAAGVQRRYRFERRRPQGGGVGYRSAEESWCVREIGNRKFATQKCSRQMHSSCCRLNLVVIRKPPTLEWSSSKV